MLLSGEGSLQVMVNLVIKKKNEVYLQIDCDPHIKHELQDEFTFDVPGAKFMPQYRSKYWDGKIRLFNLQKSQIRNRNRICDKIEQSYLEDLRKFETSAD